jgi:NAD(P)-dependent dehydrogenase (short-subunit alcohol dehydrogenase family)
MEEQVKKVILITGASGGLGSSMATHFMQQDYKLALHFFDNEISIPETEDIQHFQADLQEVHEIEAMIDAVLAVFGRIDIVINNAGISRNGMSWKQDNDEWEESLAINLSAPYYIAKYTIPHLRKNNWGRIINVSSVVAQTGVIGTTAYAASKAGLFGLTRSLSKELAAFNITVNNLALGYFNTGMIEDVAPDLREEIIQTVPLKQLGNPCTIHAALDFILSEKADFYTGQTFNLNGGLFG